MNRLRRRLMKDKGVSRQVPQPWKCETILSPQNTLPNWHNVQRVIKRRMAIVKLGLISVALYGVTAVPLGAAESEMRGSEAAAIALAVNRFQATQKRDLAHYTVTVKRVRNGLEVTFDPDQPAPVGRGNFGIVGGQTTYGPAITYTISLKPLKVRDVSFWR